MENNNLAPICLFTYNRLTETTETVEHLKNNYLASESELIIFSDGPKNDGDRQKILKVRDYIKTISGFRSVSVYESIENNGLAKSIISGVTKVINQYGKVIVVEDDLVTTPNFLDYMNQALIFYEKDKNIQSISGYSLDIGSVEKDCDIYFHQRAFPWSWGTWKNRWNIELFDKSKIKTTIMSKKGLIVSFEKKCGVDMGKMLTDSIHNRNDSWYVRWAFNQFINNRYSVYPLFSKIVNIGFGEDSTHCKWINSFVSRNDLEYKRKFKFRKFSLPTNKLNNEFLKYFKMKHKINFRLKLLLKKNGLKTLFYEIKDRVL